jgi:LPXTG-site transpeptidase (sortase) family protein
MMKLRFVLIFVVIFILAFFTLNSRFVYANLKFLLESKNLSQFSFQIPSLPVKIPKTIPLPDKATLTINEIGVSAPIIFNVGSDTSAIYENLQNGVVHYSGTPKPGAGGVSVVLGHSSAYPWYKGAYGSVFAILGKLKVGDTFSVRYEDGRTFTYSVKESIVFSPLKSDDRLAAIEKDSKNSIVLLSCWPIGTNYKRIAIYAEVI